MAQLSEAEKEAWLYRIEDLGEYNLTRGGLTKWEVDFLNSVQVQLEEEGWLSEKQRETIQGMEVKCGLGGKKESVSEE